jgi:hypothetical protein
MCLRSWKKVLESYFLKQICTYSLSLMWWFVVIFYNMIIDGKKFDLQTLMIQLNSEMELGILKSLDKDFLIIEGIYIKK